jgi:hypothetical protein
MTSLTLTRLTHRQCRRRRQNARELPVQKLQLQSMR